MSLPAPPTPPQIDVFCEYCGRSATETVAIFRAETRRITIRVRCHGTEEQHLVPPGLEQSSNPEAALYSFVENIRFPADPPDFMKELGGIK